MARLTATDLAASPDFQKLVVCDWELARALEEETWTATGSGSYWMSFTDGEVHKVEVDGTAYVEYFSIADVDAGHTSFFYDLTTLRLYVHTTAGDSPAALTGDDPKYSVVAFFYVGFATDAVVLTRYREMLTDGRMDRWTSSTNPEIWTDSIAGTAAIDRSTEVYDSYSAYSTKISVSAAASQAAVYQAVTFRPSARAMIRFKYKCEGSTAPQFQFRDTGANVFLKSDGTWQGSSNTITISNSLTWTEYSITFTVHQSYSNYELYFGQITNGDVVYIDNVECKRFYEPALFLPYLSRDSLPMIRHSVGSYHEPQEELSFGIVKFIDDGFFASKFGTYLWSNKKFKIYMGVVGATYDELAPMFTGISRNPQLTTGHFAIDIKDARAELGLFPVTRFDTTAYPDGDANWVGKPIPILLGEVENINPPSSNTVDYTYKISQTTFGGTTYSINNLVEVYKDGVLVNAGNYSSNFTNGTFTLDADPGNAVVTCRARGLEMSWLTENNSNYALTPDTWLKFFLVDINGVSKEDISWAGLLQVRTAHGSYHCNWFANETDTYTILTDLKRSAMFQIYTLPTGEINFKALTSTVPSDAQRFYNEDFITPPETILDTEQCYNKVVGKAHFMPEPAIYQDVYAHSENRAIWQQGIGRTLIVETNLDSTVMLWSLVDNFQHMLKRPLEKIRVTLPARALFLNPTDKIYISYSVVDADGTTRTVYSDQVFIILEITKNLNNGTAEIMAMKSFDDLFWLFD